MASIKFASCSAAVTKFTSESFLNSQQTYVFLALFSLGDVHVNVHIYVYVTLFESAEHNVLGALSCAKDCA